MLKIGREPDLVGLPRILSKNMGSDFFTGYNFGNLRGDYQNILVISASVSKI